MSQRYRFRPRLIAHAWWVFLLLHSSFVMAQASENAVCNRSDASQVRLDVDVTGVRSNQGNVTITIYPDDARHFLDGAYKVARQQLPAHSPVTKACFVLPGPGHYAVALFHDANSNGHFDTTWLGIPDEGYGFSRDPKLFLGPPDLDQVRIPVKVGDNPVSIEMKHY